MKKLKLKGQIVKNLKDKTKQEATLVRMEKVREEDFYYLRNILETKQKWVKEEKEKIDKALESYKQQINNLNMYLLKLVGMEALLNETLQPKEKKAK